MYENVLCTDNRFELIEKYKDKLIEATNIEADPEDMAAIDSILFRFWQMGWLDKLDADAVPVVRCKECKWCDGQEICDRHGLFLMDLAYFCADGERRDDD